MTKKCKAWPEGYPESLDYPEISVFSLLEQTAMRSPNRLAIIFGGMELTFGEFKTLSERFAAALKSLGIKPGDKVAIGLPNCPQFAIAYFGVMRIGAVFTPLSPLLSPDEVTYQLSDSEATLLITLDLLYPMIQEAVAKSQVSQVISTSLADCYNPLIAPLKPLAKNEVPDTLDFAELLGKHEPFSETVAVNAKSDLAHIAYTGGTTGRSKGVMITHYNVISNVIQSGHWPSGATVGWENGILSIITPPNWDEIKRLDVDSETVVVVPPWFHAMGTVGYLCSMIYTGVTMVVLPQFDPGDYLETIKKYQATMLGGAPQMFIPMVNHEDFKSYDFSHVSFIASGAAPLPENTFQTLYDSYPNAIVNEAYGCSECTMVATINPVTREGTKIGSVGLPLFDTEIKIIDINTGEALPANQDGEICIKGPQLMQGYWKNPEATAEVIKNGWLLTGDIGHLDEEGYLFITDRLKDMILYKGYNVYPREIEEILFRHSAIEQAAVVGKPDEASGEYPVAFIVTKEGFNPTVDELLEYVNSKIAAYKKVRELYIVPDLPVNLAGKVLKRELKTRIPSS